MEYIYQPKGRVLTARQLRLPFFAKALQRLSSISEQRLRYLPLLDQHYSGRSTRSEVFRAIELAAEQILTRLDLATGILGWRDADGALRLINQTQLAADTGISTSALSRLFARLDECGYVVRRHSKISKKEGPYSWSVRTETIIQFTDRFFRHLGSGVFQAWSKARKWARKKLAEPLSKQAALGRLPEQAAKRKLAEQAAQARKKAGFRGYLASQARKLELNYARQRVSIQIELLSHKDKLSRSEFDALVERELARRHPDYAKRLAALNRA